MNTDTMLAADYVIIGAGAIGLAFADTLLAETAATMIVVDRRASPGGHWNDAYPFVTLHGASVSYGVESMVLHGDRIETTGINRGLYVLPGKAEILAYYERLLHERLLPSGRVRYLPLHECAGDGSATSLVGGQRVQLAARRRWIDATLADTQVPATHGPDFDVADGVQCLTPTELASQWRHGSAGRGHVIVGGGKTAMDAAVWLLQRGVDPGSITWIRPREAWLLNRANVQPTLRFAERALQAMVGELEAARGARSVDHLFARLEERRLLLRMDRDVEPAMFRCAVVSEAELRRIRNVVRLGRLRAIGRERIVLDHGEIATAPGRVHLHCSSAGLPRGRAQPIFQGRRIVPQYVRRCSPCFSAAFVAHVEAAIDGGDDVKNALCAAVSPPEVPLDWLRMHLQTARNQAQWSRHPQLQAWLRQPRLEAFRQAFEAAERVPTAAWADAQRRLREVRAGALARMEELLEEAAARKEVEPDSYDYVRTVEGTSPNRVSIASMARTTASRRHVLADRRGA